MVEAASQRRAQAKARTACAALATVLLVGCGTLPERADPASDAPETVTLSDRPIGEAASYPQALQLWRSADDVNAWIGAKFQYDTARAMQLSETRRRNERLRVQSPDTFFAAPSGVCVDLARFGVETLRVLDPSSAPAYLMIEFEPVAVAGNTLRRHWVASFQRDGGYYVFADSKRPGRIAGPYSNLHEFIVEYARYRGRDIVAFRELASFERQPRAVAGARHREPSGATP